MADKSNLIMLGVLGGVGFWIYNQYSNKTGFFAPAAAGGGTDAAKKEADAEAAAKVISDAAAKQAADAAAKQAATLTTLDRVKAAIAAAGEPMPLNMDQYNWYLARVTTQDISGATPDALDIPDRTIPLPVDDWWQRIHGKLGISAYRPSGRARVNYRRVR